MGPCYNFFQTTKSEIMSTYISSIEYKKKNHSIQSRLYLTSMTHYRLSVQSKVVRPVSTSRNQSRPVSTKARHVSISFSQSQPVPSIINSGSSVSTCPDLSRLILTFKFCLDLYDSYKYIEIGRHKQKYSIQWKSRYMYPLTTKKHYVQI